MISGAPGNREQYANDRAISDWVLDRGYAFAATDKGNTGSKFFRDGRRPGEAIAEWNARTTQLARAARTVVAQRYGRPPERTIATGLSNGGYLVRWQLENHPELYDGGVDWEGALWNADTPHLLTFLPPVLRAYPRYAAGGPDAERARREIIEAGFEPGSEFLWESHHETYWDLTQRIYREELDPGYDGELEAGIPYCEPGTPSCDADYDYAARREVAGPAVDRIALTGDLRRPLLTLHGTLDTLLPISQDSDVYADMIQQQGGAERHRYYRIEGGNHTDGFVDAFPDRLRPLTPCHRSAFTALERWLDGTPPPASATIPWPAASTAQERLTRCDLGS